MTPEQIDHVQQQLSGLSGLITVDDVRALVPDVPDNLDFRTTVRSTGFRRERRRVDGVRRPVYIRHTPDGTLPRITAWPGPDGRYRLAYPVEATRAESVLTRRLTGLHGLLTADDVRALLPDGHTLYWRDIRALLRRAGFYRTQRRVDGRQRVCFVRPCPACRAEPRLHYARPDREPADLPPALHDAHGVLSARDAATLGAAPDALRRAGWRRCRARLDGRRQTVYVRPAAGDEHVWPSALPRVRP